MDQHVINKTNLQQMTDKNKFGQYFTISVIADFMVSLITHEKDSKILEPSCGKGIFLDHLTAKGYSNLSAFEIDKSLGAKYDFIKFISFLQVPITDKYDVVIGNPPYIRWKNLEPELKKELENDYLWNKYFNSLCDYLFIFILKSIEHLSENGELIFICTEYWMNTTHSMTLRNYMCQKGFFSEIYHFKETPLFEKVTASFIIFRFVKSDKEKSAINLYTYNKVKRLPTIKELKDRSCFFHTKIPHFKENNRWILANQNEQKKLKKFEISCKKHSNSLFDIELNSIGDYCDIGNGMVSGLDAAFQINEEEYQTLNSDEKKEIISVLKAKDLCPYKKKSVSKYIFVQEEITENHFESKYPHFATHFKPQLDKLKKRYNYNRNIPYWEFVFPRNQKLFERNENRIFVPCKERISNKNYYRFSFASKDYYPTQDVTAIFRKHNTKESLEYILAYLNNARVFNWLRFNGIIKGDIVEFSESPISSIPFRPINWGSENEVEIHNKITNEVTLFLKDDLYLHINNINQLFNDLFNE